MRQFRSPKPGLGKQLRCGWMVLFRNYREPGGLSNPLATPKKPLWRNIHCLRWDHNILVSDAMCLAKWPFLYATNWGSRFLRTAVVIYQTQRRRRYLLTVVKNLKTLSVLLNKLNRVLGDIIDFPQSWQELGIYKGRCIKIWVKYVL